ncbi:MAG: hypothetical protein R2705_08695 [Ilumatobacteraceae bacterium]
MSYFGNNSILVDAAKSSGGYISLLDWNYWTRQHSGLLEVRRGDISPPRGALGGPVDPPRRDQPLGSGAVDRSSSSGGSGQGALRVGSVGPEVVRLQQALLQVGCVAVARSVRRDRPLLRRDPPGGDRIPDE